MTSKRSFRQSSISCTLAIIVVFSKIFFPNKFSSINMAEFEPYSFEPMRDLSDSEEEQAHKRDLWHSCGHAIVRDEHQPGGNGFQFLRGIRGKG